jgi:hypothetical protein
MNDPKTEARSLLKAFMQTEKEADEIKNRVTKQKKVTNN